MLFIWEWFTSTHVILLHYPAVYLLIPIASLMFLLGREWLMDIRDMNGDALSGIKTLPILIGQERTEKLSFTCLATGIVLLLPLVFTIQNTWCTVLVGMVILSVAFLMLLWTQSDADHRRKVVLGLWFPMSCGILILIR